MIIVCENGEGFITVGENSDAEVGIGGDNSVYLRFSGEKSRVKLVKCSNMNEAKTVVKKLGDCIVNKVGMVKMADLMV